MANLLQSCFATMACSPIVCGTNCVQAAVICATSCLVGKSDNTTELGTYSTGAIKRIRMSQGGEVHFGDTTTSNFLGITEGAVNNFADQDRIGLYYRNELKLYSNTNTLRATWDVSGHLTNVGCLTSNVEVRAPIVCATSCVSTPSYVCGAYIKASNWVFAGMYMQSDILYSVGQGSSLCLITGNTANNAWCINMKFSPGDVPVAYAYGSLCGAVCVKSPIVCATTAVCTPAIGIGIAACTNSYKINIAGSIQMNNNSVDYVSQLHFNDNVRFYQAGDNSILNFKSGATTAGSIRFYNGGSVRQGRVYWDGAGFGLLNCSDNWAIKANHNNTICISWPTCVATCICSPTVCGTSIVKSPILCGTTCMRTAHLCSTSWHYFSTSVGLYWGGACQMHVYPKGANCQHLLVRTCGANTGIALSTDNNTTPKGFLYANNSNQFGLLDYAGSWRVQVNTNTDIRLCNHTCVYGNLYVSGMVCTEGIEGDTFNSASCKENSITCFNTSC